MKITNLLKKTTFISISIILIFLCIANQKENTKLKILIWNTPSLPLGAYLLLSTGTGYIFSYIFTANILAVNQIKKVNKIKYKVDNQKIMNDSDHDLSNDYVYNKTLIERDFNDPSPTINASFRVIGNINKIEQQSINNNNEYYNSTLTDDSDNQQFDKELEYENDNILNDWYDYRYLNW